MSFTSYYISLLIIVLTMATLSSCQFDLIRTLLGLTHIQGTLYCTLNGNMIYGLLTPTFPNAAVEMHCGAAGTVISSVKSDATGRFSMLLDAPQLLLSFLLNNCSLVVTTPLVNCNGALPSFGALASPLQLIRNTFLGLFNVTNIIPVGFRFLPIL
ncbi:phylloplanin-like [Cucurbita maxima]|uniref:Phylloplanin-like n=1 Tax=Cucurbita maxima TaxID=3661 RepID=A0A6J1KIA9_CUCMA|nr:phylloplanin-like [Cucurbita maxima]